jgi:hypothetical protein
MLDKQPGGGVKVVNSGNGTKVMDAVGTEVVDGVGVEVVDGGDADMAVGLRSYSMIDHQTV